MSQNDCSRALGTSLRPAEFSFFPSSVQSTKVHGVSVQRPVEVDFRSALHAFGEMLSERYGYYSVHRPESLGGKIAAAHGCNHLGKRGADFWTFPSEHAFQTNTRSPRGPLPTDLISCVFDFVGKVTVGLPRRCTTALVCRPSVRLRNCERIAHHCVSVFVKKLSICLGSLFDFGPLYGFNDYFEHTVHTTDIDDVHIMINARTKDVSSIVASALYYAWENIRNHQAVNEAFIITVEKEN
jgi:hypothetical protein